jgi:ketosteroid isomerase-like protein
MKPTQEATAMQDAALKQDSARSKDLEILEELNRNYVRSAEQSDVRWYSENLAEDFLGSSVDGSIIDRTEFLKRMARPYSGSNPEAVDVRIRIIGEVALIHAGFKYQKPDGRAGTGRYTDVWAHRQGRWLCVSAHFNRF